MKEDDMSLLGVGSNEARTSHEGTKSEDSHFTQGQSRREEGGIRPHSSEPTRSELGGTET
jgi:hypothetical protein